MSDKGGGVKTRESAKKDAGNTGAATGREGDAAIMNELKALNKKLDGMSANFEKQLNSKVDNLRSSLEKLITKSGEALKAEIEKKAKEIRDEFDMEIGQLRSRVEAVEAKLGGSSSKPSNFDPDESIIVSGLPYDEGEDVQEKVKELLVDGLNCDIEAVAVERTKPRGRGPGVVKVQFRSVREKVAVLREKQKLKNHNAYERVYLRSAKSHTDRLIELNFRTILREIPGGNEYFITGSGRVKKRETRDASTDNTPSSQP
ncbi:uncharacterized protein LOC144905434 [Branchiostoma floridae x Branchiostoma belcheri]